jgi:membrane-bound ClpP family serine protease
VRPRRALAVCRRLLEELRRDHRSLALLFVAPIVITGLLAFILREQDAPEPRIAVVALDQQVGPLVATAIADAARQDGHLVVVDLGAGADEAMAQQAIRDDRIDLAVIIPDGFAAGVSAGTGSLVVLTAGVNSAQEGSYVGDLQSAIGDAVGAWPRPTRPSRTSPSSIRSSTARPTRMSSTSSRRPSWPSSRTSSSSC